MKYILILLSMSMVINCDGQSKTDSLKDYSYLILRLYPDGTSMTWATGSFIKKGENLFLVGAFHTFGCINTVTKEPDNPSPDSLMVRVFYKGTKDPYFFPIHLEKIKKETTPFYYYENPDIYVYDVTSLNLESKYDIFSIEKYMVVQLDEEVNAKMAISFGFPKDPNTKYDIPYLKQWQPEKYKSGMDGDINLAYPLYPNGIITHTVEDTINLRLSEGFAEGRSGSPVFFIQEHDGVEQITFGGIVTGAEAMAGKPNRGVVVRSKFLYRKLMAL